MAKRPQREKVREKTIHGKRRTRAKRHGQGDSSVTAEIPKDTAQSLEGLPSASVRDLAPEVTD